MRAFDRRHRHGHRDLHGFARRLVQARPLKGSCHCGAVTLEVDHSPAEVIDCNCSLCRRLGALWAYYHPSQVRVLGETVAYVQKPKNLALRHCAVCGCVTHYETLKASGQDSTVVNARMLEVGAVESARVRRFDGAENWVFLD